MPQAVQQNAYLGNDKKNSFGRTEIVRDTDGARGIELARVAVDEVKDWTVTVDVQQYLAGTLVVAAIEYGAGNVISTLEIDASDHIDVCVTGDYVRLWVTVEQVVTAGHPAGAQVGGCISADVPGGTRPSTANYGPNVFGPGAATNGIVPPGVASRMVSFSAYTDVASGGATRYLMFFDSATTPPANGTIPVAAFALPAATTVSFNWLGSKPFSQGLVWAVSTTPDTLTLSTDKAMVSIELTRVPLGQVVTTLGATG